VRCTGVGGDPERTEIDTDVREQSPGVLDHIAQRSKSL
jgi:hypothetical protein